MYVLGCSPDSSAGRLFSGIQWIKCLDMVKVDLIFELTQAQNPTVLEKGIREEV